MFAKGVNISGWQVVDADFLKLLACLPQHEREQVTKYYHKVDQLRTLVGKLVSRQLLMQLSDFSWDQMVFSRGPYGKPELSVPSGHYPIYFNISHAGDWVFSAANQFQPVGVDVAHIQVPQSSADQALFFEDMTLVFTDSEWTFIRSNSAGSARPLDLQLMAFYLLWAMKEALVKAAGMGLNFDLNVRLEFSSFIKSNK
jgi:4'-phosphopantetheinyl transferase